MLVLSAKSGGWIYTGLPVFGSLRWIKCILFLKWIRNGTLDLGVSSQAIPWNVILDTERKYAKNCYTVVYSRCSTITILLIGIKAKRNDRFMFIELRSHELS